MKLKTEIFIPADVPPKNHAEYQKNYNTITHNTGRLFLFACDQKIEHLNADFYGNNIHTDAMHPQHLFKIAHQGRIGAMATHLGLIARYANQYTTINYIAKLNGKTNLINSDQQDPLSSPLHSVHDVIKLKDTSNIPIKGVGFTVYIGSEYENKMLHHAAKTVFEAHQHGLVAIIWVYPRGKNISDDSDPQLIAGAAGLAHALGADFVKIKQPPAINNKNIAENLQIATYAAGNTRVICSGGPLHKPENFLRNLHDQIHTGNTSGCATGRNIFQHSLPKAVNMTKAIASIVIDNSNIETALTFL